MVSLNGVDATSTFIAFIVGYFVLAGALYFLMSYGFYRMAVKRNISKAYLAFIPFVRYVVAGKVIGDAIVFGKRTNKLGLIVAIISGVNFAISTFMFIYNYYFVIGALFNGAPIDIIYDSATLAIQMSIGEDAVNNLMNTYPQALNAIAQIADIVSMISSLAWLVFSFIFWNNLFVKFKPGMAIMYAFISVILGGGAIIPFEIAGLFVFIFRNRDEVKPIIFYNTYSSQGGYTNYDPYGRNNQQGYDPYGRNNNDFDQTDKEKDPFEEFGDSKDGDDPFGM